MKDKDEENKELRQEMRRMAAFMQWVLFELERDRELSARDRENLRLSLDNRLLRFERRLPPGRSESEPKVLQDESEEPEEP